MEGSGRRGRLRFGVRLSNTCMVRDDLLVNKVKVHVVGERVGEVDVRHLGLVQSSTGRDLQPEAEDVMAARKTR